MNKRPLTSSESPADTPEEELSDDENSDDRILRRLKLRVPSVISNIGVPQRLLKL